MKTKAVRLYGKNDLRMEEFELPQISEDQILAKVMCDSICMSSYKASHEADIHKRVPRDIAENPVIIGHEFAGEIIEVGAKWKNQFTPGQKFSIQPALNYENGPVGVLSAPGYSYHHIGGDATYVVIPNEVMEKGPSEPAPAAALNLSETRCAAGHSPQVQRFLYGHQCRYGRYSKGQGTRLPALPAKCPLRQRRGGAKGAALPLPARLPQSLGGAAVPAG